jgi:peptidoglycan/xylan/chitin deacetylase (PgdA/CDA1 family)
MSDKLKPGILIITIDLEFSWGVMGERYAVKEEFVRRGRQSIPALLDVFREFRTPATWAIVGRLLLSESENRDFMKASGQMYQNISLKDENLWYAKDLIEQIVTETIGHEIGSHSFSHLLFGKPEVTQEIAEADLEAFQAICRQKIGLQPVSFVYPQHSVGFKDLLPKFGFIIYRGTTLEPFLNYPPVVRKLLRLLVRAFGITPPVAYPVWEGGLIHLPASMHFALREGAAGVLITPKMLAQRAKRGILKVSREGGVFSLYFHDHNVGFNPSAHLGALREVLVLASRLREEGELKIMTMMEFAGYLRDEE